MSALFDDVGPRYLRALLDVTVKQHAAAAANIANVDTPGYRAQELDFRRALAAALQSDAGAVQRTDGAHLAGETSPVAAALHEVTGLPVRNDGNNVSIDREMLHLADASGRYAAAITLLQREFALLRYAIGGGRQG
ncbi:MAG: flagellar basal body rod protein FlgB [Acidobacteriota bacterium]